MKLRTNLFLIIGSLLLTLLVAQWWVLTHLKQQLREEVSSTAFEVSRDTASAMILHQVKIRTEISNEKLQKQRWEWQKQHPNSNDTDIFLELRDDQSQPVIQLLGPGLQETIIVSQRGIDASLTGLSSNLLYSMGAFLLLALILAGYFSHRLAKPLQNLVNTAKHVGDGHLGEQVETDIDIGPNEVQMAIAEFNSMSAKLKQLEQHNRQLQNSQQLSELGEIARGFAHSLRNPLNTLGLASSELADENLSEDKKHQLNQIVKRQIERIDNWVKSFMALSQDGAVFTTIDVVEIVDDIVLELSSIKPEISWHLEMDQSCKLTGIEQEIRTIVQVLLENAMEACGNNGVIQIFVDQLPQSTTDDLSDTGIKKPACCIITIKDNGSGIPESIINKLFVPQVTSKGAGSGMGLFIAKRLVESRYQGTLELRNRAQGGVEVTLVLNQQAVNTNQKERS